MNARPNDARRSGFSTLEMLVSVSVLVILTGALVQAVGGLRRLTVGGTERALLQADGTKALTAILEDLRCSGFASVDGKDFPYLFDGGEPDDDFDDHAHAAAAENAEAGDDDFGPDREIVFVLPADDDEDGVPDVDADGELVWDDEEISYVLVTGADGTNRLERRVDGANGALVARNVERIVFDDAESSGFEVPLDAVRVRIFMRRVNALGDVERYTAEAVVGLCNG